MMARRGRKMEHMTNEVEDETDDPISVALDELITQQGNDRPRMTVLMDDDPDVVSEGVMAALPKFEEPQSAPPAPDPTAPEPETTAVLSAATLAEMKCGAAALARLRNR